jgi:hypothetical protein
LSEALFLGSAAIHTLRVYIKIVKLSLYQRPH